MTFSTTLPSRRVSVRLRRKKTEKSSVLQSFAKLEVAREVEGGAGATVEALADLLSERGYQVFVVGPQQREEVSAKQANR